MTFMATGSINDDGTGDLGAGQERLAAPQDKPTDRWASNPLLRPAGVAGAKALTAQLATSHYENFLVTSVLLPRRIRPAFYDVYAFCRTADDAADQSPSPREAMRRLAMLRGELEAVFDGRPRSALGVALAETAQRYELRRGPFEDLLSAFEQDQTVTRYADDASLLEYCRRSANPVGRIVLRLAGADDDANLAASDSICTGLQLINFWQDIARDLAIGRVYVPADRMAAAGVESSNLAADQASDAVRELTASLVDWARGFFTPARSLSDRVPRWLSPTIDLFAGGGIATADAIGRGRFDVLGRRPTVSRATQVRLVVRAAAAAAWWRRR